MTLTIDFDIIKCIVPLCSSFDGVFPLWIYDYGNNQSAVVTSFVIVFFGAEADGMRTPPTEYGDFPVTTLIHRTSDPATGSTGQLQI